ncbi:MAG: DNA-primase RepB domain-containing protein, partial [Dehalococcoidia bacterium]
MERLSHQPIPQEAPAGPDYSEQLAQLPVLWETVFGDRDGVLGLFSGTRVARRLQRPRDGFFHYPDEVPAALAWVRAEADLARELYHCSHLLVRPRRRKVDAAPLTALYADVDDGQLTALSLAPSAVVESSPGRLQAYWRLSEPVEPEIGEALNRRLALAVNADKSGWDLTQLLRLPGTRNHKYAEAPAVRLLTVSDAQYEPATLN